MGTADLDDGGEDSCAPPDPCEISGQLVNANEGLTISTIGVRAYSAQLACIADRGNGIAVSAESATQLARRLPALSNTEAAAAQLSPSGAQRVRPGTQYSTIRDLHPDFPELPETTEDVVRVTCLPLAPCPPSEAVVERAAQQPAGSMQIGGMICSADRNRLIVHGMFDHGIRGGQLVFKRDGLEWVGIVRVTHQGDCYSLPDDFPLDELSTEFGGLCNIILTKRVMEAATLSTDGFGPLKIGMSAQALSDKGFARQTGPNDFCRDWKQTELVPADLWLEILDDQLTSLSAISPQFQTVSGAHVGMSVSALQQIYPGKLETRVFPSEGDLRQSYVVISGSNMVEFVTTGRDRPSDTVSRIIVSPVDNPFSEGC